MRRLWQTAARIRKDKENVKEMLITAIKKEKKAIFEDGLQKGIETGKKKGQHEKSIDIAKRMLALGQDIEVISKVTGLSKKKIRDLT